MPAKELPRILDGEGYGIIEDSGGALGLEDLTKAFKKRSGREYKKYSEWLGLKDFDMSAFDLADANLRVKKIPRIYADIYERSIRPTQISIDFLDRKYLK